jgi:hypothetical protein
LSFNQHERYYVYPLLTETILCTAKLQDEV